MSIYRFSIRILPLLGIISLLSCGEMNTIISSTGSYKVDALVATLGLDECSILGPDDSLNPVLSMESTYDPDAVIFQISLRDQFENEAVVAVVYRERRSVTSKVLGNDLEGVILVDRLTDTLPAFYFPADLPMGMYKLIFEVRGEGGILFEKSQSVFFTGDTPFILKGLASYPPGTGPSSTTLLIPQSVYLLMVAEYESGEDLDPYFIWSFGAKRLAEGFASEGLDRLLWKTPSTDGFHRLQVEMLPDRPSFGSDPVFRGFSSELAIATSSSAPLPGLPGPNSAYLSIFRFLGNLDHTGSKDTESWNLMVPEDLKPEWSRFDSGYGLTLDPQEAYKSEGTLFPVADGAFTPHALTILLSPGDPGRIFSAVFDPEPVIETESLTVLEVDEPTTVGEPGIDVTQTGPSSGVVPLHGTALVSEAIGESEMDDLPEIKKTAGGLSFSLEVTLDAILLKLVSSGEELALRIAPDSGWNGEAHTVRIEFIPEPEILRVSMTLDRKLVAVGTVSLPGPLSGSGHFELGGSEPPEESDSAIKDVLQDLAVMVVPVMGNEPPPQPLRNSIIDDFALERLVIKPAPVVKQLAGETNESL